MPRTEAAQSQAVSQKLTNLIWQGKVISITITAPPSSPSAGDRYVIPTGATGAWTGLAKQIAEWSGLAWVYLTPTGGESLYNVADGNFYNYLSSAWSRVSSGVPNVKGISIDGGGVVIPNNTIASTYVPANFTITGWNVISQDGTSGSIAFDVFTVVAGSFVPNSVSGLTSIVGTGHTYPTLSSAVTDVGGSVANWTTTSLTSGYYLVFSVTSITSIKSVRVELIVSPR